MDITVVNKIREWSEDYQNRDFICSDPVSLPHRYTIHEDIEISGLLTAILSFGNRKMILKKADELDGMMHHAPLQYVLSEEWRHDFKRDNMSSFYRMLSYNDFYHYFDKLYGVYRCQETLEDRLMKYNGIPMSKLCAFMGVTDHSPQKKLNMFLRWMIRKGSCVDFGIWSRMSASDLIIPLDTHVCRVAFLLGLTDKQTFSLSNAIKITNSLKEIFPEDPCRGDYALFGYGVNHKD